MTDRRRIRGLLEWGVAAQPFPGEGVSGDRHAVVWRDQGALLAVIDALGHGTAAETTAKRASSILERHAHDSLLVLIERCHRALLGDRGVVMSLATIDGARDTMVWAGVGNVSALLLRCGAGPRVRRERLVQPAGIVGAQLPALRESDVTLSPGDLLVFATDGIRDGFGEHVSPRDDPQRLAERLILDYARRTDDALVLVARYLGGR